MYTAVVFLGINNSSTVLHSVDTERTVMYRERFAGMYSSWAYSLAQVIIECTNRLPTALQSISIPSLQTKQHPSIFQVAVEVPYLFMQAVIYVAITYPMIGYYGSAYKVFWCFYAMFCTLTYFNYMGMMLVSLTPSFMLAAIISSAFYTTYTLFAGFLIPKHVSQCSTLNK